MMKLCHKLSSRNVNKKTESNALFNFQLPFGCDEHFWMKIHLTESSVSKLTSLYTLTYKLDTITPFKE